MTLIPPLAVIKPSSYSQTSGWFFG